MAVQYKYQPDTSSTHLTLALKQVTRRIRMRRWMRHASIGMLIAVVLSLVSIVLDHFAIFPDWVFIEVLIPILLLCGLIGGTITAFLRPISIMDAARLADVRLGLKERLSSALELEKVGMNPRDPEPSLLVRMLQRDADAYAGAVRATEVIPMRPLPRETKLLFAGLIVLILAYVLPNLPWFNPPGTLNEHGIVARAGQQLAKNARLIEKNAESRHLEETKRVAQDMKRLGNQMAKGRMNKKQAFQRYARLTEQMQKLQNQMQQKAGAAGQGSKSLAQAGQQLAQALQNQGSPGNGSMTGNKNQSSNPGNGKNNANGSNAKGSGKGDQQNNKSGHGFNIPGFNQNKPGQPGGQQNQSGNTSPSKEMQQVAQAMQQGNTAALSQQLRQLAQRADSGSMSAQDKQQAAQDLQQLANALKDTPMPETQRHAQAASDALKRGDAKKAAEEMRKAADAADKEMRQDQDRQGVRDAQNSLQNNQNNMAGAMKPADMGLQGASPTQTQSGSAGQQGQNGQSGQSGQSGQQGQSSGDSSGNESGQGDSSGSEQGSGNGNGMNNDSASKELQNQGKGAGKDGGNGEEPGAEGGGGGSGNRAGRGGAKSGHHGSGKHSKFQGPGNKLNPSFDPSKNPHYARVYLGKPGPGSNGSGRIGKTLKVRPGGKPTNGANTSVPYYDYAGPAKKAAEHAVDTENIPPAYKDTVRKYFDEITPKK